MIDELATPKYVIWGISPDFLRGTFDTSISKIDLSLKVSDKLFLVIKWLKYHSSVLQTLKISR